MWRYPDSSAEITAARTAPAADFQVPRPTSGIDAPLERVTWVAEEGAEAAIFLDWGNLGAKKRAQRRERI